MGGGGRGLGLRPHQCMQHVFKNSVYRHCLSHLNTVDAKARRQRQQQYSGAVAAALCNHLCEHGAQARAGARPHEHPLRDALCQVHACGGPRRCALRQTRAAVAWAPVWTGAIAAPARAADPCGKRVVKVIPA